MKEHLHMTPARLALAASIFPIMISGHAFAGGFALNEMSAASVGNAHAGAATAQDASTVFYNPAAMTRLSGRHFTVVGSAMRTSAKFGNAGSLTATGAPLTGGGGNAGGWSFVPAMFYTTELAPRLRLGLGLHVPFGLKTEYDGTWVGRYQALKSELKSININPALAWQLNDMVSIGGGISAQYADVELSRAIDFGSICVGSLGVAACAPGGFLPQTRDGKVTVSGNDWGYGFNFGVLITPTLNTRYGLTYRSKISHTLSGDASFARPDGLPAPLAASPTFSNGSASASVDLPESVSLHGYAELDQRWSAMADLTWMRWSRFQELRIRFANGAPDSVTPEKWQNTLRVAAALNYRYNDAWKLRGGVAWDPSPVKGEFRTARIPDASRTWLSFGAQYKPTRHSAWDFGYAHLFTRDAAINKAEPPVGGTLIGSYDSDVNILSVQYNHAF